VFAALPALSHQLKKKQNLQNLYLSPSRCLLPNKKRKSLRKYGLNLKKWSELKIHRRVGKSKLTSMTYKVVPFTAQITRQETTAKVATQLQNVIDKYTDEGWEYVRLEVVEAEISPDQGCFGIGAKPGFNTVFRMIVFKK
jgi:hypothetical protein